MVGVTLVSSSPDIFPAVTNDCLVKNQFTVCVSDLKSEYTGILEPSCCLTVVCGLLNASFVYLHTCSERGFNLNILSEWNYNSYRARYCFSTSPTLWLFKTWMFVWNCHWILSTCNYMSSCCSAGCQQKEEATTGESFLSFFFLHCWSVLLLWLLVNCKNCPSVFNIFY